MFFIPTAIPVSTEESLSTMLDRHCKLDAPGVLATALAGLIEKDYIISDTKNST